MKKQCSNCEFTKVTSLLGSRASGVQVQVLSPAPKITATLRVAVIFAGSSAAITFPVPPPVSPLDKFPCHPLSYTQQR